MGNKVIGSKFTLFYVGLVFLDIFIGGSEYSQFRFLTKPLILLSLLIYFGFSGRHLDRSTYTFMLLALIFSLVGDILLLYDHLFSSFFIMGLISFLIAHILYFTVFLKRCNKKPDLLFWLTAAILGVFGSVLFFILKNALADLKIPVIIYILGILGMAISAFGRKKSVSSRSFNWVFLGALLFVASDSLLALNRFMFDIPWSHFLVMGTYAAAQYLIVQGILEDI